MKNVIVMDVLNDEGTWHQWWQNFTDYYKSQGVDTEDEDEITRLLSEWRAVEEDQDSSIFYFENEHDLTLFLLRWS
jgi:hypothetical protein